MKTKGKDLTHVKRAAYERGERAARAKAFAECREIVEHMLDAVGTRNYAGESFSPQLATIRFILAHGTLQAPGPGCAEASRTVSAALI